MYKPLEPGGKCWVDTMDIGGGEVVISQSDLDSLDGMDANLDTSLVRRDYKDLRKPQVAHSGQTTLQIIKKPCLRLLAFALCGSNLLSRGKKEASGV